MELIGSHCDILDNYDIDIEKLKDYSVILLPENIESKKEDDKFRVAPDSISLYKILKSHGIKCANSNDLGIDSYIIERRGGDYWLGTIWILQYLVTPIVLNIISDRILKSVESKKNNNRAHLDLRFPNGDHLRYDGEVKTLCLLIHSLENESTDASFNNERDRI